MSQHVLVEAQVDPAIKEEASIVLAEMGLTIADAVRLMLTRVAEERVLPFGTETPNARTQDALEKRVVADCRHSPQSML